MTAIDATPVTLDVGSDGIARLVLNRPEASNGLNVELLKALHEAILRCHADASVRVVLKTAPLEQWAVAREMRQRIKFRFDHEGIELAHPTAATWGQPA